MHDTRAHNNIMITDSTFTSNTVDSGGVYMGGGLYLESYTETYNIIAITNSTFSSNTLGGAGAGLFLYFYTATWNIITITSSTFISNGAGIGGGGLVIYFDSNINNNITITNSTLTNNNGSGLFLQYVTVMLSQVAVSNNADSGLLTVGHVTVIFTDGHSIVANNSSPTNGGGIYLGRDSYLTTSNGGHVSFINNTAGKYGGAIYSIDNDYISSNYGVSKYDDQCTIYELSATFISNSAAITGDLLYGGIFIFCNYYYSRNSHYIQDLIHCSDVPDSIRNVTSAHAVSSDPLVACPCINDTFNCTIRSLHREIYPGQVLKVSLVTVGLCGGASPGTVLVENSEEEIDLISSATTDYTLTSCTTLNYTVKLTTYISTTTIALDVADNNFHRIEPINVYLTILSCPLGLVLNSTLRECACNANITHIPGVSCNISWMPYPIQRSGNNWISKQYNKYNCTIAHTGCPFDYCITSSVKFSLSESDLQCNYNRSGILCGQCTQGLSLMMGSNRCANCTDTTLISISIIIIATVAGVVLVILLIVLNLTVSIGSINGLLLYANVIKLNESVFFSQGNIPVISQFISWCNLDLGIEYCFIDGLDGYVKTWLQFLFPLYVWVLVIVIIVGCRYSSRLCRLCGRNAVPVLATLILMSYTKLSRTVTNALMMNTLQCGEHKWSVWNVDGNINYLSGKHIALFIVSLLFLVIGLVYTGLVFSSQWLQRYSGKCCKSTRDPVVRLKPLIDAYTGPYKDKYRFWTGLGMAIRFILTIIFSFTTGKYEHLNNLVVFTVMLIPSMMNTGSRVYKNILMSIVEMISNVNLLLLSFIITIFSKVYPNIISTTMITTASVTIEMLLFIIVIIGHIYHLVIDRFCKEHNRSSHTYTNMQLDSVLSGDKEDSINNVIIKQREPLIF